MVAADAPPAKEIAKNLAIDGWTPRNAMAGPTGVILPGDHGFSEDLGQVLASGRAGREFGDAVLRQCAFYERRDI
jgi:hypothetical protein